MALKISAGLTIIYQDSILLSHPTNASWFGTYGIIKGGVEPEENLLDAAFREFYEETGFRLSDEFRKKYFPTQRPPDKVVQNSTKVLSTWFVIVDSPEEIGLVPSNTATGGIHTVYNKNQLQLSEIDWAGFVSFEDAKKRMAPYQLEILLDAVKLQKEHYSEKNKLLETAIKTAKQTMIEQAPKPKVTESVDTSTDMTKLMNDQDKHVPYIPMSDICEGSLGTVVPKGMYAEMMNALSLVKKKLKEAYNWDLDDYVQDRLQYTPEELGIDKKLYDKATPDEKRKLINGKLCDAFAGEQMDALALAIFNIEASTDSNGYGMIVGDMTGIGKGRIAAGLIRYCIKFHKTVPVFITEKGYLFSDIYRDLADIKSDPMIPIRYRAPELDYEKPIKMSNAEIQAEIKERLEMGETEEEARESIEEIITKGFKTIYGYKTNKNYAADEAKVSRKITRIKPFILNARKDETSIKDLDGNIIYEAPPAGDAFRKIIESKKLPKEYGLIMLTYSQINRGGLSAKMAFLQELTKKTIVICDESHTASGVSNTGKFIFDILAHASGAAFLSATYSKRPDNMVVYASKTSIREAELEKEDLIDAIKRGGVPLQEIIGSQLVGEGQMVRRERTYAGVDVLWNVLDSSMAKTGHPEFDLKDKHSAISNMFTEVLRDILDLQNQYIRPWLRNLDPKALDAMLDLLPGTRISIERGQDVSKMLTSSPIFSRVFNLVNQLLFSIKAEAVADRAINYMKQGKKPVIAFSNTMGAFLDQMRDAEGNPLSPGDIVDTDFKLVLDKLLKTLLIITAKDPMGESQKIYLQKTDLPIDARNLYSLIEQKIRKISIGISISPIDVLHYKIKEAGFKVEEVTGRKAYINYTDNTFMTGSYQVRQKPTTSDTFRGFNENRIDCLLINQSGAVGASFHASPNKIVNQVSYKAADGTIITGPYQKGMKQKLIVPSSLEPRNEIKQRVMIMLQSELNINTEVQKRGRIFRSGQVLMPMYEYLCTAIPAEQRLQMMMQKKLRSLDANTSSNQKSSDEIVNVIDFLNPYGDIVVIKYLMENKSLVSRLGDPFSMIAKDGTIIEPQATPEDAAHRLTGRIAVLSVSDQENFYTEVTQKYIDFIKLLDATGKYTGEVKFLDLQAETLDRNIYQVGSGGKSFFGKNTIIEACEVNNLRKPYTQVELDMYLNNALGDYLRYGEDAGKRQANDLLREHKEFHENRLATIDKSYKDRLEYALSRLKEDSQYKRIYKKSVIQAGILLEGYTKEITEKNITDKAEEIDRIKNQYSRVRNYLEKLYVGMVTRYTSGKVSVRAVVTEIEVTRYYTNPFAPSAIYVRLAIANGIRMIMVPLSDTAVIDSIISNQIMSYADINQVLSNWDEITKESMADRMVRYILTGNILQAMGDPVVVEQNGQLVKFTHLRDGKVFLRNGVLMSADFNPAKHTSNRGSKYILVPANKCKPIIEQLDFYSDPKRKVVYELNNHIQISRAQNGSDFLIQMPNDKAYSNIYKDPEFIAFLNDEKGFTNWGSIMTWNSGTQKKEDVRALGGTVEDYKLQDLLNFLSRKYRSSFKISVAVFNEFKDQLGVDMQDNYGDGIGLEESESGLAQTKLIIYDKAAEEVEEAVADPVSEYAEDISAIEQKAETPTVTEIVDITATKDAQLMHEKMQFDYERKLFKLIMLLVDRPKMAAGGAIQERKWQMSDFTNPAKERYLRFVVREDPNTKGEYGIYDREAQKFVKEINLKGVRKQPPYALLSVAENVCNKANYDHLQYLDFIWNHESGGELSSDQLERSQEYAASILEQLGGYARLRLFAGVEDIRLIKNGISIKLPYGEGEYSKCNMVKITLNGSDTYDVEFGLQTAAGYEVLSEKHGVYDDMLMDIFEEGTGLFLTIKARN